jgi:tetratricopeptide (TPR) repeat protein
MALALGRLATIHRASGRLPEARQDLERCRALATLDPLPADEQVAVARVSCESATAETDRLAGDVAACVKRLEPLWPSVEAQLGAFPLSGKWYFSVTSVGVQLALCRHQSAAAPDDDARLMNRVMDIERLGLALAPDDESLRRAHALTLRDAVLPLFDLDDPTAALALGQEAIEVARPLSSSHDYRGITALGSTLRQHAMMLSWTARSDEAPALLAEARQVLERGLDLEPRSIELLGELGDTLLELGDGPAAVAVLERALALGATGDYAESRMMAVLLAGDWKRVLALHAEERGSIQGDLAAALAALALGDRPGAHDLVLRLMNDHDRDTNTYDLQWPRGKVAAVMRRSASPLKPEALTFIDEFEVAFPRQDEAGVKAALEHLERSLRKDLTPPR